MPVHPAIARDINIEFQGGATLSFDLLNGGRRHASQRGPESVAAFLQSGQAEAADGCRAALEVQSATATPGAPLCGRP